MKLYIYGPQDLLNPIYFESLDNVPIADIELTFNLNPLDYKKIAFPSFYPQKTLKDNDYL